MMNGAHQGGDFDFCLLYVTAYWREQGPGIPFVPSADEANARRDAASHTAALY